MLENIFSMARDVWIRDGCGVDRDGRVIEVLVHSAAYDRERRRTSVLVLGDLTGRTPREAVTGALADFVRQMRNDSDSVPAVSFIPAPCVVGTDAPRSAPYPPGDGFFDHGSDPVTRYLWRWAGCLAPDLIVELRSGETTEWQATDGETAERFGAARFGIEDDSLLGALSNGAGDAPGTIPGIRITAPNGGRGVDIERLLSVLNEGIEPSGARRCLVARRKRSPADVVRILTSNYGYTLDPVVYTQGVSIGGRLVAWETGVTPADPTGSIRQIAESLLADPGSFIDSSPDAAALAGLTWACDLARISGDEQARKLFLATADSFKDGGDQIPPPPAEFDFRVEDMYYVATVLGQAYCLIGNNRYSQLLEMYIRSCLRSGVQRPDGLFDHSQGARFPWGRGNGFAALGYAEAITYLAPNSPVRSDLVKAHRTHLAALLAHAAPSGKQRQLADFPGSYEELSATCMLGVALARGVRLGWLDDSYAEGLNRCWNAASEAIADDGRLVDVCAGTGPQMSVREYLDRPAVSGFDDRGGAMAMWFALEMAKLARAEEGARVTVSQ